MRETSSPSIAEVYEMNAATPMWPLCEWVAPKRVIADLAAKLAGPVSFTQNLRLFGRPVVIDEKADGLSLRPITEETIC